MPNVTRHIPSPSAFDAFHGLEIARDDEERVCASGRVTLAVRPMPDETA